MTVKACYVMRADLPMSRAKFGIQLAHGTDFIHTRASENPFHAAWLAALRRKAVLKARNLGEVEKIAALCHEAGVLCELVIDEGLTEFGRRTTTGLVILPTDEERLPRAVRRLRLWTDADGA